VTCLLTSTRQTWFPPEARLHRGRRCSAGSESPTSSPPPSAAASVPLAGGLPRCRSLFFAGRACPCGRAARRRRVTGPPQDRFPSRRGENLPGSWAVLFVRAVVEHPAGYDPSLPLPLFEEIHGKAVVAFGKFSPLGIRNGMAFEAACLVALNGLSARPRRSSSGPRYGWFQLPRTSTVRPSLEGCATTPSLGCGSR
jgi:hypothetical protein